MSERTETEIKSMTKEQNYMCGYRDGKSDVLDKIRAEINELPSYVAKFNGGDFAIHIDKEKVLDIIDKYKEEREEKNEKDMPIFN